MKRLLNYTVLLGFLFSLIACEDFLTLEPKSNSGTTGSFYKNETDIEYALTGIYANLQVGNYYHNGMVLMTDVRSDDLGRFANTGGNAGREYYIKVFTAASDNQIFLNVWTAIYQTIYRCNKVLSQLEVVTNEERRQRYEAEIKFLRALCYFNIVRFWGDAPLLLEPLTPQEAATCIRDSKEKIYEAIEADLRFSSNSDILPVSFSGSDAGRATSLAAQGLLGKVYLTQGKFQNAARVLGELINTNNNGTHQLLPDIANVFSGAPPMDSPDNDFRNYTGYKPTKMNKEVLFAVLWSKNVADEGRGALTYYNNEGDLNEDFKLSSPTCLYAETDRRRDLIRNMNGSTGNNNFILKYADYPSTFNTYEYSTIILRWSDILLMYAEALNELSFDNSASGVALQHLNVVRTRSYPEGTYTATDLPSQEAFRKAIWLERRMEFPMEMQRWFDLIRTGQAIEEIGKIGITITSKDLLYPIPYTELILRNDPVNFPQNPGY